MNRVIVRSIPPSQDESRMCEQSNEWRSSLGAKIAGDLSGYQASAIESVIGSKTAVSKSSSMGSDESAMAVAAAGLAALQKLVVSRPALFTAFKEMERDKDGEISSTSLNRIHAALGTNAPSSPSIASHAANSPTAVTAGNSSGAAAIKQQAPAALHTRQPISPTIDRLISPSAIGSTAAGQSPGGSSCGGVSINSSNTTLGSRRSSLALSLSIDVTSLGGPSDSSSSSATSSGHTSTECSRANSKQGSPTANSTSQHSCTLSQQQMHGVEQRQQVSGPKAKFGQGHKHAYPDSTSNEEWTAAWSTEHIQEMDSYTQKDHILVQQQPEQQGSPRLQHARKHKSSRRPGTPGGGLGRPVSCLMGSTSTSGAMDGSNISSPGSIRPRPASSPAYGLDSRGNSKGMSSIRQESSTLRWHDGDGLGQDGLAMQQQQQHEQPQQQPPKHVSSRRHCCRPPTPGAPVGKPTGILSSDGAAAAAAHAACSPAAVGSKHSLHKALQPVTSPKSLVRFSNGEMFMSAEDTAYASPSKGRPASQQEEDSRTSVHFDASGKAAEEPVGHHVKQSHSSSRVPHKQHVLRCHSSKRLPTPGAQLGRPISIFSGSGSNNSGAPASAACQSSKQDSNGSSRASSQCHLAAVGGVKSRVTFESDDEQQLSPNSLSAGIDVSSSSVKLQPPGKQQEQQLVQSRKPSMPCLALAKLVIAYSRQDSYADTPAAPAAATAAVAEAEQVQQQQLQQHEHYKHAQWPVTPGISLHQPVSISSISSSPQNVDTASVPPVPGKPSSSSHSGALGQERLNGSRRGNSDPGEALLSSVKGSGSASGSHKGARRVSWAETVPGSAPAAADAASADGEEVEEPVARHQRLGMRDGQAMQPAQQQEPHQPQQAPASLISNAAAGGAYGHSSGNISPQSLQTATPVITSDDQLVAVNKQQHLVKQHAAGSEPAMIAGSILEPVRSSGSSGKEQQLGIQVLTHQALLQHNAELALEQQQDLQKRLSKLPTTPGVTLGHASIFKEDRPCAVDTGVAASSELSRAGVSAHSSVPVMAMKEVLLHSNSGLAAEQEQQWQDKLSKRPPTPASSGQAPGNPSIFRDIATQSLTAAGSRSSTAAAVSCDSSGSPMLELKKQHNWNGNSGRWLPTPGAGLAKPCNMFSDDEDSGQSSGNNVSRTRSEQAESVLQQVSVEHNSSGRSNSQIVGGQGLVGTAWHGLNLTVQSPTADGMHGSPGCRSSIQRSSSPLQHSSSFADPDPSRPSPLGRDVAGSRGSSRASTPAGQFSSPEASVSRAIIAAPVIIQLPASNQQHRKLSINGSSPTTAGAGGLSPSRLRRSTSPADESPGQNSPSRLNWSSSNNSISGYQVRCGDNK